MTLVIKPNETISVNQVIKRGSFPSNLRIKRIFNSNNLQAQYLPEPENDYRPFEGRCKGGKGKRIVLQKSMQTDDLLEAAKRAIIWVEEIAEKSREVKEKKQEEEKYSLHHYWKNYLIQQRTIREQQRNFNRWKREELLKWEGDGYGIGKQGWSKISCDRINRRDFEEYFDLLEKRARLNNGSNGSGMKGQQKTLIRKLLTLAENDFVGHSFPNFPKISKEYKQVKHLTQKEWNTLRRHIFDLGEGMDAVTFSDQDYRALPHNPQNNKNVRNWVDVFDAINLQWFYYFRAEDMYRLKAEWFRKTDDGWICDLETTKKDRPKHTTFYYRPDAEKFMDRLMKRKPKGYLIFPDMRRPVGNAADSRVLEKLNDLLKVAIQECLPDFSKTNRNWTTLRHTSFRLTLEENPNLGIPPRINAFADNGHTSADQLRKTYLRYMDSEATAREARQSIPEGKNVRWGGKYSSKKDIK